MHEMIENHPLAKGFIEDGDFHILIQWPFAEESLHILSDSSFACKNSYTFFTKVSKWFYLSMVSDFTTGLYTECCAKHKPK